MPKTQKISPPQSPSAAGWLTIHQLIGRLADEGIFLGRSPVRYIRHLQAIGQITKPTHEGKGNVAYYAPECVREVVALKRRKRIGDQAIEDLEHNSGAEMLHDAALVYWRGLPAVVQIQFVERALGKCSTAAVKTLRAAAQFTTVEVRGDTVTLTMKDRRRTTKFPTEALVAAILDEAGMDKIARAMVLNRNLNRSDASEMTRWSAAEAYLAWELIRNYELMQSLMLAGGFARVYHRLVWANKAAVPMTTKFLEKRFRRSVTRKQLGAPH